MKKSWNIPEILNLIRLFLVCTFVWVSGYFSKITLLSAFAKASTRLYIIGLFLFFWLIRFLIIKIVSHKTNQKFLYALVEGDSSSDPSVQKDKAEQKSLRKSIFLIISTLKANLFFNRSSQKCFVKTPWFLVMGPKNSGKSSAIQNADLDPPILDDFLQRTLSRLQETSETKWSFFKEGVFIEIIPSQEKEALPIALIKLLKKYRHHKPVEGVILTCDINELITMDAETRDLTIKQTKQSLSHLQKNLGLNLSIYILFTKCDLIQGFTEYFSSENHTEKALGFEIKSSHHEYLSNQFKHNYDSFISHLQSNLSLILKENISLEFSKKVINFPQQIAALRNSLEYYVSELFLPQNTQKTFFLHGVYFSSALQEGKAQDYYLSELTNAYKLTYQAPLETVHTHNKSFFLSDFFGKHITFNASETTYNSQTKRLLKKLKIASYCAFILLMIGYGILSYRHYVHELKQIQYIEKNLFTELDLNPSTLEKGETWGSFSWLSSLNLLKSSADSLNTSPWPSPSMTDHILKLRSSLMNAFYYILDYRFLPLFFYEIEERLQEEKDPTRDLELLKIYLLFNANDQTRKISLEKPLKEIIRKIVIENNKTSDKRTHEYMHHLDLAFRQSLPYLPVNFELIESKRQTLDHSNLVNQLYHRLQSYGEQNYPNPFVPLQVCPNFYEVFIQIKNEIFSIPALYTQQGFQEVFQKQKEPFLEQLLQDEQTVGLRSNVSEALKNTLREQLDALYAQNYFINWQNFLTEHTIIPINDLNQLLKVLKTIVSKDSPLIKTLTIYQDNVSQIANLLTPSQAEIFSNVSQLLQAKENNPAVIQILLTQLTQLNSLLAPLQSEADIPKAAFSLVQDALEKSLANHPLGSLKITASSLPEPLSSWVNKIITDSWEVLLSLADEHINKAWQITFKKPFEEELTPLYPFSAESTQDAPLSVFKKFFGPNGAFDQFYKTYLHVFDQGKTVPFAKTSLEIHKPLIHTIHKLQQLMFDEKGNTSLAFSIEPHTLDKRLISITWTLANQKIEYRHGPLFSTNIQWFVPNQKNLCTLSCTDFQGKILTEKYDGPWSIFKMIDHQSITEPNVLNIALGNYKAQFLIQGALLEILKDIRALHLPNRLAEKKYS